MAIALQAFSLRDECKEDFFGTLKKIKSMGYDAVELAGLYDKSPKEIKEFLEDIDLIPCSAHVGFNDLLNDEVLDMYSEISVEYIVIPGTPFPAFTDDINMVYGAADKLADIGKRCKSRNLKLALHNHTAEFVQYDGVRALDILTRKVGLDYLEPEFDTAWVNSAGEDPAELVKQYSGYTSVIHIKDFIGRREDRFLPWAYRDSDETTIPKLTLMPLGEGVMDIPNLIAECKKSGTKWYIIEQDDPTPGKTPLECAEISIGYLKKVIEQLR